MKELLTLIQPAFEWTWKNSLQVALLVVLVLLVQKALGRWLTPRLRYALSLLVLLRLLLPAAPPSSLSLQNLWPKTTPPAVPQATAPTMVESVRPPAIALEALPVDPVPAPPVATPSVTAPIRTPVLSLAELLALAWAGGLVALVSLAGWRYVQWCRSVRHGRQLSDARCLALLEETRRAMGVHRPVTLVAMTRLGTPAVFGCWRVRLLLPETAVDQLTDQELRLLFLHEMAHVRRQDMLLNLLLMAVQFVHWFNPLVWLGLHRLRTDRELVCDAMVLQRTKPEERLGYGSLLLKLLTDSPAPPAMIPTAVPVVGSKSELKQRIILIKRYRRATVAACVATGFMAVVLACVTFTASSQQPSLLERPRRVPTVPTGEASFNGNLWVLKPDRSLGGLGDNWPIGPAQFVEVFANVDQTSWLPDSSGRLVERRTSYTIRSIIGTNRWWFEASPSANNGRSSWWYTGTNTVHLFEVTKPVDPPLTQFGGPRSSQQRIGDRWATIHPASEQPNLVGIENLAWLAFCSGPGLKTGAWHASPPSLISATNPHLPNKTELFDDALGLPKRVELYSWDKALLCLYEVRQSTNISGWSVPLQFQLTDYGVYAYEIQQRSNFFAGTTPRQLRLSATIDAASDDQTPKPGSRLSGIVTSVRLGTGPQVPPEVITNVARTVVIPLPRINALAEQLTENRRKAFRGRFEARMKHDQEKYSPEQLLDAENMYRVATQKWGSPEATKSLQTMIRKYPDLNRTGCAALSVAQRYQGQERAKYLQDCVEKYDDCLYSDGVQVGAYARFLLVEDYGSKGEEKKAEALHTEIEAKYADAIDHDGKPLVDNRKAKGVRP